MNPGFSATSAKNPVRNDGLGWTRHHPLFHSMTAQQQSAESFAVAVMMGAVGPLHCPICIGLGLISMTRVLAWLRLWQLVAQE